MLFRLKNTIYVLTSLGFLFLLTYGGLGVERSLVSLLGFYVSAFWLFCTWFLSGKLLLPKFFKEYSVFLILLFINTLLSYDYRTTSQFLLLYLTGGIIWLISFNSPRRYLKYFSKVFISLGIIYGALFIFYLVTGDTRGNSYSLYLGIGDKHNHLGDLWSFILTMIFVIVFRNKDKITEQIILIISGLILLFISGSKSAYLAVCLSGIYFLWKSGNYIWRENKKKVIFLIVFSLILFAVTGLNKSTLFSRGVYFTKALNVVMTNPFRSVGVGNFGAVSYNLVPDDNISPDYFTTLAHNIIFEFLVGMGVFGLSFLYWISLIIAGFVKEKKNSNGGNLLYKTIFIAMTVNFLFDYTYVISTLVWIWFWVLGAAQKNKTDE